MASIAVPDNIVIDDVLAATSVGETMREVFTAAATGLRREYQITMDRPGAGESERMQINCFPVADTGIPEISIRLHALLSNLIEKLAKRLAEPGSEKIRFYILLPPEASSRSRFINSKSVHRLITQLGKSLAQCEFHWSYEDTGAAATLAECCRALSSGEVDTAVFGGVDTLVNFGSITELFRQGRIPKDPAAGSACPGEAAAFILLRNASDIISESANHAVYVNGIASGDEPRFGQAERSKLTGLASSINNLFASLGLNASDVPHVVHNLEGENTSAFEWLQVENAVWPNRLPEELRQAMQDGELDAPDNPEACKLDTLGLIPVLGDTGAAQLPLSIGLGAGKLDFHHQYQRFNLPPVNDLLVVDAGHSPVRGAVYLRRGDGHRPNSQSRMN